MIDVEVHNQTIRLHLTIWRYNLPELKKLPNQKKSTLQTFHTTFGVSKLLESLKVLGIGLHHISQQSNESPAPRSRFVGRLATSLDLPPGTPSAKIHHPNLGIQQAPPGGHLLHM